MNILAKIYEHLLYAKNGPDSEVKDSWLRSRHEKYMAPECRKFTHERHRLSLDYTLTQDLADYPPQVKFSPGPGFVKKDFVAQPCLFVYILSMAASTLQHQSLIIFMACKS